jgi:dTDP-3-amino-3,4,6-trideoxy-alpha-D-glucose transaminase
MSDSAPANAATIPIPRTKVTSSWVPFVDLALVHEHVKRQILQDIAEVIETGSFIDGAQVPQFEQRYADFCGTRFCVGVSSGLDALRLAFLAGGVEPGAEIIVPANTFIATVEAIRQAGAEPLFVDADERDYNVDPAAAAAAVTPRTQWLAPVHLYGQMADMRSLVGIANTCKIGIIEDACQAHGAKRDGLVAGACGLASAFSFYPAKNLGALGDAGAVVTSNSDVAAAVRALRSHGQTAKYRHEREGYTARLDTIQAVALLHKLPLLDRWNQQRSRAAAFYIDALAGVGDLVLPPVPADSHPAWHLFVITTKRRGPLEEFLHERGIATGRHYPEPLHLMPIYRGFGYRRGAFPVAERLAEEALSLPIFPSITEAQLTMVVTAIRDFYRRG